MLKHFKALLLNLYNRIFSLENKGDSALRLEYLKTFLALVKTGRFLAAAKELHLSQATVTNHIAILEKHFDAKLLNRTAKGVELTPAGKILKDRAEKIINEIENAKVQISLLKHEIAGLIKIVASTIPGEHIIPSLIAEFKKKHPAVDFNIMITDTVNALICLEKNMADFAAVGSLIGYEEKFEKIELAEEELVLIVPRNHELEKRESIKLHEILKYPYINREETSGTRKEVAKMLKESRIRPQELNTVFELGSTQAVITAVAEGRGISIISSIAARKAEMSGLIKAIKISHVKNTRKLYIVRQKKELDKACQTFWDFCKESAWPCQCGNCGFA